MSEPASTSEPVDRADTSGVAPAESSQTGGGRAAPFAPVEERRTFGNYELRFRLASGGMATVYLAQKRTGDVFSKWVAVKVILPEFASDARFAQMFLHEARLSAQISHPNVCDVFDFGEVDGRQFIAMEYLNGEALTEVLRCSKAVPPGIAARIVADAARGLHAAHELRGEDGALAGVVHRDVSPQNIFVLYDGVAKVVDFGIARSSEQHAEVTRTGEIKGKLAYMAPEQVRGEPLDRRADIFALGVVLWELLAHKRLFKRGTDATTMLALLNDPIQSPVDVNPSVPEALATIALKALSRDVGGRYATSDALARDLDQWLASTGTAVGPAQLADYMRSLFANAIDERNEFLRRETSKVRAVSSAVAAQIRPSNPGTVTTTAAGKAEASVAPTRVVTAPPRSRAPRLALVGLGVAAAAVIAWRSLAAHERPALVSQPPPAQHAQPQPPEPQPADPSRVAVAPTPAPPVAPPTTEPVAPPTVDPPVAPRPDPPVAEAAAPTEQGPASEPHHHEHHHGHTHVASGGHPTGGTSTTTTSAPPPPPSGHSTLIPTYE